MSLGGETPKRIPNPMIVEIEPLNPHQRANTRDPSIENPLFRAGRGYIPLRQPIHLSSLAYPIMMGFAPCKSLRVEEEGIGYDL